MMKLILSLTLIWTLCSTAEALWCWTGTGTDRCLKNCSSTELCGTIATRKTHYGKKTEFTQRWCLRSPPYTLGDYQHSHILSSTVVVQSVHVCNTDQCNSQDIPYPAVQEKNNLTCFTCDDLYPAVCDKTVQCVGIQDRCMNMTEEYGKGKIHHEFGCVSANYCEVAAYSQFPNLSKVLSGPNCCESSFCNSAWSVKLNMIPLLFGLFTLIIY